MNEKLIVPNEFLSIAEEELKQGKSVRILADGTSMNPFILGGRDYAEITPLKEKEVLILWNVYLFKYNGKYIIHRYIGKDGEIYRMRGDGNLKFEERIERSDVIGLLNRIYQPSGKYIETNTSKWRRTGKNWNKLLPIRRYLLAAFRRLRRYGIIR